LNRLRYRRPAAGASTLNTLSAPGKPLQKERWAGVVDAVGSHTLANAVVQTRYGGTVTACGLAQGMGFPASVGPFILRSVRLVGIDSVMAPLPKRIAAWERLAHELDASKLETITQEIGLAETVALGRGACCPFATCGGALARGKA
jgi:acrylyl-CoA reductase (NADPH)